jgi:hypothetical protein
MARKTEQAPSENGQPSHTKKSRGEETFTRADFFRDLKKIAKKQDQPSQPEQEGR